MGKVKEMALGAVAQYVNDYAQKYKNKNGGDCN